jgi:hypothetical protein
MLLLVILASLDANRTSTSEEPRRLLFCFSLLRVPVTPELNAGALGHMHARVETHIYSRSPAAAFDADSNVKDPASGGGQVAQK